jgi:DNA-binding NtrC family response regulator
MSTSRDKPFSSFDTLPLTEGLDEAPSASTLGFRRRFLLVVYHRDGVEMVPLPPAAGVVVGRDPLADVPIQDGSLSRRHARFTLDGGEVVVEDLGSTNGTRVAGQRIERSVIKPGDEVQLGSLTASVHELSKAEALARTEGASLGIQSHEAFQRALEAEIGRARFFGRKVALLLVHARNGEDGNLRRWLPRVRELLRPVDIAALYSADAIEILAPEMSLEQAMELARAIVAPRDGEPGLGCGVAGFPDAATSAEKLIEVGREAARLASEAEPVRIAPTEGPRVWLPGEAPLSSPDGDDGLVAKSQAMRIVIETAQRVARSSIPVLLQGETGTGKEVLARLLHGASPRRAAPLICVNCGAIPQSLAESTLFGYERGAFTGAMQQQKGVFEAAHGGTVLLDEIGELPAAVQAALLRVTETKRVARVGSTKEIDIDVRLIAATHRDLEAMADAGSFRRDLLYRLNAMTLTLPPLRERPEDIGPLAVRFLERASRGSGRQLLGIRPEAFSLLEMYAWPGNVRELRNAIERAVAIAASDVIEVRDLPERVRGPRGGAKLMVPVGGGASAAGAVSAVSSTGVGALSGEVGGGGGPAQVVRGTFKERMEQLEVEVLIAALREAGWNQTEAARRLDMPLRTLQYKIKTHGIKRGGYKAKVGEPE